MLFRINHYQEFTYVLKNEKYSLENIIECLLLMSDEPLSVNQILKILENNKNTKKTIEHAIHELNKQYEDKAIHINKVSGGYRFQVKSGIEHYVSIKG